MNHYHGIVKFKLETLNQVNSSIVSQSGHYKRIHKQRMSLIG